jgi:hypothetical protein
LGPWMASPLLQKGMMTQQHDALAAIGEAAKK